MAGLLGLETDEDRIAQQRALGIEHDFAEVVQVAGDSNGRPTVEAVLALLSERGVKSVLVEPVYRVSLNRRIRRKARRKRKSTRWCRNTSRKNGMIARRSITATGERA